MSTDSSRQPASFSYSWAAPVDVLLDELFALLRIRIAVVEADRQLDMIEARIRFEQLYSIRPR